MGERSSFLAFLGGPVWETATAVAKYLRFTGFRFEATAVSFIQLFQIKIRQIGLYRGALITVLLSVFYGFYNFQNGKKRENAFP